MSLSAAVIRELVAAGLAGHALVEACERIEASSPVASRAVDEQAERRRAADRERKRLRNSAEFCGKPLSPLSPPSHTQPPLYPPNPDGVAISPAPSERAAALRAIEGPCLEIVAGTDWPVTTAQDWHALTAIVVEHRLDPETELLPSIREQVARKQAKRETVRNWGYFVPGCLSFAAKAREPPKPLPEASSSQTYRNGARNDPRANTIENALARLKNSARGRDGFDFVDGREMRTINAIAEPG